MAATAGRKSRASDSIHAYAQLEHPVMARHVRVTNWHTPGDGVFSISGLRVFGSGLGKPPGMVSTVSAQRPANRRLANVSWEKATGAEFYIVRYGINPDRLTHNYQVYEGENATLSGLNTDAEYFATVDAVNDNGLTKDGKVVKIQSNSTPIQN